MKAATALCTVVETITKTLVKQLTLGQTPDQKNA